VYALFSNDPEARKQRRQAHQNRGAFRSGQADEAEQKRLQKQLQERERL
jgi:hypothetical protein